MPKARQNELLVWRAGITDKPEESHAASGIQPHPVEPTPAQGLWTTQNSYCCQCYVSTHWCNHWERQILEGAAKMTGLWQDWIWRDLCSEVQLKLTRANNWILLMVSLKIYVFKTSSKAADGDSGHSFDFIHAIFYPGTFLTHITLRMFSIMFIIVSFIRIFLSGMKR